MYNTFGNNTSNTFGTIKHFDIKYVDWDEYIERIEQYLIANDIDDEHKKVAVFFTIIGAETYSLLRNLMAPIKPATRLFKELTQKS